jgi:hypothetical protein
MAKKHIRKAPLDGFLHFGLISVHSSITQLLFRRSVIDKLKAFDPQYGVQGDIEWNMRASSIFDVIHIPEFLATWRRHDEQASPGCFQSKEYAVRLTIIKNTLNFFKQHQPDLAQQIPLERLSWLFKKNYVKQKMSSAKSFINKLKIMFSHPVLFVITFFCGLFSTIYLRKKKLSSFDVWYMSQKVKQFGLNKNIILVHEPKQ